MSPHFWIFVAGMILGFILGIPVGICLLIFGKPVGPKLW